MTDCRVTECYSNAGDLITEPLLLAFALGEFDTPFGLTHALG